MATFGKDSRQREIVYAHLGFPELMLSEDIPLPKVKEAVSHPAHYSKVPGVECIDVVEQFTFNIGNALKYLWRADHKDAPIEDLQKALWYIQREIDKREKK